MFEGTPEADGLLQSIRPTQMRFRKAIRATAPAFRPYERRYAASRTLQALLSHLLPTRKRKKKTPLRKSGRILSTKRTPFVLMKSSNELKRTSCNRLGLPRQLSYFLFLLGRVLGTSSQLSIRRAAGLHINDHCPMARSRSQSFRSRE